MSITVQRPSSAPPSGYVPLNHDEDGLIQRCHRCFKKMTEKPFASVAGPSSNDPRKFFCSKKCFQAYLGTDAEGRRKRLVHFAIAAATPRNSIVGEINLKKG